jgi:hypothetical protein
LSWYRNQPADRQPRLLQGINGIGSIEDSMTREHELLNAWHALSDGRGPQ